MQKKVEANPTVANATNNNKTSNMLDTLYLEILKIYGELTITVINPVILDDYFPEGFGKKRATVAEYGVFLTMLPLLGKQVSTHQLEEQQPFLKGTSLDRGLRRMLATGKLEKRGLNHSVAVRENYDHQAARKMAVRALPLAQQLASLLERYVQEFERQDGHRNGRKN